MANKYDWLSVKPTFQEDAAATRAMNEATAFLGVNTLPSLAAVNAAIAELLNAASLLGLGAPIPLPVASISVSPPSLTLSIDTIPTQVAVDHIDVTPASLNLTAPVAINFGTAIRHVGFGRTNFGVFPNTTDQQWMAGAPLFRMQFFMNGNSAAIKALNPTALNFPYGLHHRCEATGQEVEGARTSWGTLANQWAQANGRNVENIFLHAAIGQQNRVARTASVTAGGLVTLGKNPSNNKQQLTQFAFHVGDTWTFSGVTGIADGTTATVTSIVSSTQVQTDYAGAAGTGGLMYVAGDGTLTPANRCLEEDETDWMWIPNFGSQDGIDFQVYRFGQCIGPTDDGMFWDSHSASTLKPNSVEYGLTGGFTKLLNDCIALFRLYRTTYPGKLSCPNLGGFTSTNDAALADAGGACQNEGALNIFSSNHLTITGETGSIGHFTVDRQNKGTIIEVGLVPEFNNAEPHAGVSGLSTAFRNSGGHNYGTPDDRAAMTAYAAAMCLVKVGQPKFLFLDPAGQFFDTFPLSARWETGYEFPLGEPVDSIFPALTLAASVPGSQSPGGVPVDIIARVFSQDGTTGTPLTAIIFFRESENGHTVYDATTAQGIEVGWAPPGGTHWGILLEDGTTTGSFGLGNFVQLWHVDSVILVPVPD